VDLEPEDDRRAMTDPASRVQPVRRRRRSIAQAVLVVVVLSATVGILRIVVQSSILLGRMTTDVATAQGRATNLSNSQREALQLLQRITALERGGGAGVDDIDVRRRLLGRQLGITTEGFPADSPQRTELIEAQAGLAGFPWSELDDPDRAEVLRATAMALVSQVEIRIKGLWDEQEKYFYQATLQSLEAKNASERALIGLVSLVVVLGICWVVLLKRRTRSDLSHAYDALVGEMSERQLAEGALRISEVRFRSLVQRASDLTAVTDITGIVGYLSPAAEGILGVRP
jgi:PAS domain-containing protein